MQLRYAEMHGTGNRILVVDERAEDRAPPPSARIKALAGSGAAPAFDQLMWVQAGPGDAVARYRVFNADGSEVEQCGNGARCVAKLLALSGKPGRQFRLTSPAGNVDVRMLDDDRISVNMGGPEFEPDRIPFVAGETALQYPLEVGDDVLDVAVLSMGNPHCVLTVDDPAAAPVDRLGPLIERHPRFPQRVNVGFMRIRARDRIDLRVHERGVGETRACGTGACAAVVAGRRLELLDDDVTVNLPGGPVMISWRGLGEPVWLTGEADFRSEGTIDL